MITDYTNDGTTATITITGTTFVTETASTSGVSIQTINLFTADIAPAGSSSVAKYVTVPVKLALPSTFVKIRYSVNCPSVADVEVYYKTSLGNASTIEKTKYTLATPTAAIPKVSLGDVDTFKDVDYKIENMAPFDTIKLKLVFKSTNSSAVPQVKDLRVIACA